MGDVQVKPWLTDQYPESGAAERRQVPRRVCRVKVAVQLEDQSLLAGRTVDLSQEGLALLLPRPLPPGSVCRVDFALYVDGVHRAVAAAAEVSNCVFLRDDVRIGLRFTSLDKNTKKMLSAFVAHAGVSPVPH